MELAVEFWRTPWSETVHGVPLGRPLSVKVAEYVGSVPVGQYRHVVGALVRDQDRVPGGIVHGTFRVRSDRDLADCRVGGSGDHGHVV